MEEHALQLTSVESPHDAVDDSAAVLGSEDLVAIDLFQGVDTALVEPLIRSCTIRKLQAGETLIAAGEPNDRLYILLSGRLRVQLEHDNRQPLTVLDPGESVGEMSLIDNKPASAFVVADEPSRLLVIDEELMWILAETSHPVSINLLSTLVRRVRCGNEVIREDREQIRRFRFQATIDPTTGLFNRYWLEKMLPRQIQRARKSSRPLVLLMIDIDHFKALNDRHGHVAGDRALHALGVCLQENLRPADMPARYGGEEFVVLLPDSTLEVGVQVAQRLRARAEALVLDLPGAPMTGGLTISIGVSVLADEETAEELIGACDVALYRAKTAGRNCVSR